MSGGRHVARMAGLVLALSFGASGARAHDGPPYPILVDQRSGPFLLSVWADPDVGTGTFFVYVDPPSGTVLAPVTRVRVYVRPHSGRLAETGHDAAESKATPAQYYVGVPFDAVGPWTVRVVIEGPHGTCEAATTVEVTPPGLGAWDLVLYAFPFALLASLWTYGVARHGLRRRRGPAGLA